MMGDDLTSIARQFRLRGEVVGVAPLATGHINDTFILTARDRERTVRYLLQRINHDVFKDPPQMMENIVRVTEHIREKMPATRQLSLVPADDDAWYHRDNTGNFWRMYDFIEDAVTYDTISSADVAFEAARMFGWFQRMLADLPGPALHETIPGFHDTPQRFKRFQEVLKADVHNRAKSAHREIDFVLQNAAICGVVSDLVADGELPLRITHNDAKINNVMLDKTTGAGVCVIDLDTVMPGLSVHDFGDLVRTAACPAAEDECDLSKVALDISLFDALARGFAAETSGFLSVAEREHLVFGVRQITFEQCIRFLTDYLAGDVYYRVHRQDHNLDRTRTQMELVQSIIEQEETMNRLVERAFQNTPTGTNQRNSP
jgi:hypothetical protein